MNRWYTCFTSVLVFSLGICATTHVSAQTTAYGIDASSFPDIGFSSVPIPTADAVTSIGATSANVAGGDFGPDSLFYGRVDNALVTISLDDGSATTVAQITGVAGGQTIIGMGYDQTGGAMYLATTNLSSAGSELYTIDLSTAVATRVGAITNASFVLAIAVDPAGQIYAFDETDDNLVSVDGGTAAGTIVGPLTVPFVAQDADFDASSGILYWTFFSGGSGRLATVDVTTAVATTVTTWSADFIAFAILGEGPPTSVRGRSRTRPESISLAQNFPNPFNPETVIQYQLDQAAQVELAIFNLLGDPIRTLVNEKSSRGAHQVRWDGLDDSGHQAASGVYFYRLKAGSATLSRRMLLTR